MSSRLFLHLSQPPNGELLRSVFHHELFSEPQVAVRGKTSGAYRSGSTFQWSSAVRGLTALLLREAAQFKQHTERPPSGPPLSGIRGSLAASLDYALTRQPRWITEMFGSDHQGNSFARRLFIRTNPNRKLPGPVSLALRYSALSPGHIRIFQDDVEIVRPEELIVLADSIDPTAGRLQPPLQENFDTPMSRGTSPRFTAVKKSYRSTSTTDRLGGYPKPFLRNGARTWLAGELSKLCRDKLHTNYTNLFDPQAHPHLILPGEELGLPAIPCSLKEELSSFPPTEVTMAPYQITGRLLFEYLQTRYGYHVTYRYCSSTLDQPASPVVRASTDRLLVSFREHKDGSRFLEAVKSEGSLHLLHLPKSVYQPLLNTPLNRNYGREARMFSRSLGSMEEMEEGARLHPECYHTVLKMGLLGLKNHGSPKPHGTRSFELNQSCVTWYDQRHDRNLARILAIGLREAWCELESKPDLIEDVLKRACSDHEYITLLTRCSGLQQLISTKMEREDQQKDQQEHKKGHKQGHKQGQSVQQVFPW